MTTHNTPRALREEASHWWVRLDGGDVSAAERRRFDDWLATSPEHRQAFEELTALWGELDALKGRFVADRAAWRKGFPPEWERVTASEPPENLLPASDAPQFAVQGTAPAPLHRNRQTHRPRSRLRRTAGLGAAAGLLLALASIWQWPADYRTGIGEMRTVRLEDGSSVHLSSNTSLDVEMTATARHLHVRQGEAWFEVVKDPARPFVVAAGKGTATALGTVYDVRHVGGEVRVAVIESQVAVSVPGDDGHPASVTLEAGQQATYRDGGHFGPVHVADVESISAWRRGKLVFENRSLGEVITELNRYHRGVIAIADAGIRERPVSGVFRTDAPLEVVAALESALDLKSTQFTDYLILLHR